MVLLGLSMATLLLRSPGVRLRAWRPRTVEPDVLMVARLLALSVSAGLPLGRALGDVRERLPEAARHALDDVLTRAARAGLARALVETTGPLGDLAARLAKAQISGAPLGPALDTYIAAMHDARRSRAVEDARTIGVRLILPLTLLLFPGFVALVITPFLLEQVDGLLGGVVP